jgi:hypothetical protein
MNTTCSPVLHMLVIRTTVSTTFLSPGSATSNKTPLSSLFIEFFLIHYDGPFLMFFTACRSVDDLHQGGKARFDLRTALQLPDPLPTELRHTLN